MIEQPYPSLENLMSMIGSAGKRMSEINASEGTAGNISVCVRWDLDVKRLFPIIERITLPQPVPVLAGAKIIVSGSGTSIRDIQDQPTANLACLIVNPDGQTADQYTSPNRGFKKVTSEFNSHLAVHADQIQSTNSNFHAVIHVHPPYLTFLSHIPRYQDFRYLNTHLLRWQPEYIVCIPQGIGFSPFTMPGSKELTSTNMELFRAHKVVIWAKHGVMACSDNSVKGATDLIEYAEASARNEYLNLCVGEIAEGLSVENIRAICETFKIKQNIF